MTLNAAHSFRGTCHCGAIRVRLAFTRPAADLQVRSCQCGFCTRQGSLTVSDPDGRAVFEIDAAHYVPYAFATGSATSVICGKCGVYAGAVLTREGKSWSIANTRGLGMAEFRGRVGDAMEYEQETAAQRVTRRQIRWTPTEIRLSAAPAPAESGAAAKT